MKKILIFLFTLLLITGCEKTMNNPKSEVQRLFSNYNLLSSDLLVQLDTVIDGETLNEVQKTKYKDVLKRQYEDLKYKIKDEVITDDKAIVSVEIEVYDLRKVIKEAEDYKENNKNEFNTENEFDNSLFWDYKLDKMYKTNDRITQTLDLSLTKIDNRWVLDNLLETDRQKIHGLYK